MADILDNPIQRAGAAAPAAPAAPPGTSGAPATTPTGLKDILDNPIQRTPAPVAPKLNAPGAPALQAPANPLPITPPNTSVSASTPSTNAGYDTVDALKTAFGLPGAIVDSELHPSEGEQQIESQLTSHPTSTLGKIIQAIPNAATAATTRFFQPAFQPVADDISQAVVAPDFADKVAKGEMSYSAFEDAFPALQKSNLQVIGDTVIAGLTIYAPELLGETVSKAAAVGSVQALKRGAATGAVAGGLFATAQVLSSGTTDPKEIAKIYAENIVGGTLLGGLTHAAVPLTADLFNKATKDIQTKYGLPTHVYIDATKVKDIFQTGKLASEQENELIRSLGLTGEQYRTAIKEGLSIEIPAQNITTITDKPYWAAIKDAVGMKPTSKTIVAEPTPQVSERIMNPERQLPSPQDVRAQLDGGNTPDHVSYALQKDMSPEEADSLVKQAQELPATEQAPAAPAQVPTELPRTLDESVLNKTPGDYQQDFASVQVAHDSKVEEIEASVKDLEGKVAAAPAQSAEKKSLKVQLSDVKNQLKTAQESHQDSIVTHAGALSSIVQGHLETTHAIEPAHSRELAARVISHITEPNEHENVPLKNIAARLANEHHESTSLKRGEDVTVAEGKGTIVRPTRMPDGKPGYVVETKNTKGETVHKPYSKAEIQKEGAKEKKPAKESKEITRDQLRKEAAEYPRAHNFAFIANRKYGISVKDATDIYDEAKKPSTPASAKEAADTYWEKKIKPAIEKNEAVVIGADDLKDFFGNDYAQPNHKMYSEAANALFERALKETKGDTVKFTVGGTGAGKSDFIVAAESEGFNGIIYDSTGWNYDGLKKQSAIAEAAGKKVEIYGVLPDLVRSRAYTFAREAAGQHPVSEAAFVKTHAGAIDTMIKLIKDGADVWVLDTRDITDKAQVESAEYEHNPLAVLENVGYSEEHVRDTTKEVSAENAQAVIDGGKEGARNLPKENGADSLDRSSVPEDRASEKVPRAPKEKSEKEEEPKPEPKKTLDSRELYDAERAIEQNRPRGYAGTVFKEVATWFNPRGQAQTPAVDVIMRNKGEYERTLFRTERATRQIKKMWDTMSQEVALDFMDKVETDRVAELPPEFKEIAEMYRERLTNTWAAIQEFKSVPFMENYFPHLWKDPEAVREANLWSKANAKRPFQGNKSFTKHRIFATIQDGIKAGYELETHNPEELMQLHEQNVQKFLMANRIMDDLKARGFSKLVRSGGKAKIPDGFARINDNIAKVYLNPHIPILEAYDEEVYNGLSDVISSLGLEHDRKYNTGKSGTLGFTQRGTDKITTKFGTPLSIVAHELGHQLDYKYGLQQLFKTDPDRTYGSESDYSQKELRKLADLRYAGHEVTDSYKQYVRSAPEKMAVMLEAYVHAPEKFKEVAPRTFEKFTAFLALHPETKPILDIKPSLVYGTREDSIYAGGLVLGGEYWVQKDVARMLNNYLSPDFIMDTALGKGIMNVKNTMNAFELGFSAFHLTMESLDTMITKFSIGLSKIVSGDFTGFGDMIAAPVAPVTYFRAGQKFYNGDPEMLKIENDLFTGGASLREKQYYKNTVLDSFMETNREILGQVRRGELLGAAKSVAFNVLRLPMSAVEATMRPLFTYYIPRLKVGAFRDLFAEELKRNSQRIQDGETTQEEVARTVWNSIENRMGELNYDNLFWNRNLKTGLMLTTRAVGWNLGTVRELGGGFFQDLPREALKAAKGKGFNFTPKMAYTLSLFFFVASLGAVYQYLHTGKKPGSVKDLFYPQNGATTPAGEPYRIEFPTYLKDIYQSGVPQLLTGKPFGAFDSFSQMLKNKSAPELTTILDIMGNQDFYGNEIRNPHDNAPTQLKQLTLYLLSQFVPFTIQQQQNLSSGKSTLEQQVEAFFGIIKAPSAVIQSDFNAQLQAIYQDQNGLRAPMTPEEADAYSKKQAVVDQIKKGDYSGLQSLVDQGIIKPTGIKSFLQNAVLSTPQKQYKFLSGENKAKVLQGAQ